MLTQNILDRHKPQLSKLNLFASVEHKTSIVVTQRSLISFVGHGEPFILHDGMTDFLLCGYWNQRLFMVGGTNGAVEEIPAGAYHLYLNQVFRSGHSNLYLLDPNLKSTSPENLINPNTQFGLNESTNDKYELHPAIFNGMKVYRIKALKTFGDVSAGELGGYVQTAKSLSQEGDCWVYGNAFVADKAKVYGNAKIKDNATVNDTAKVYGNAVVSGNAAIYQTSKVFDNAVVTGKAGIINCTVKENALIDAHIEAFDSTFFGKCVVNGNPVIHTAVISGKAKIHGKPRVIRSQVYGNAQVYDEANLDGTDISGNASAFQKCTLRKSKIYGNAEISGVAVVANGAEIYGNAVVNGTTYINLEKPGKEKIEVKGGTVISSGFLENPIVLNESTLIVAGSEVIR